MADMGGSSTDVSAPNLDNAGSPSSSNDSIKEGALKRPLNIDKETAAVKKKRSAEEIASTSKGRNQRMKKAMKDEKKKKKRMSKVAYDRAELISCIDELRKRLGELEDRDVAMSDREEEKLMKKEDAFRRAILRCQKALTEGESSCEEDEESVISSLDIHIPNWPSLDVHVNEFAMDRLYSPQHREKGAYMTHDNLNDMIKKVKEMEPTIGLPTKKDKMEMDRLLNDVNDKMLEAVRKRRVDCLMKNLEDYLGVDPIPMDDVQVNSEDEEREPQRLNNHVKSNFFSRVMEAYREDGIEVINLDDSEDEEEGDDVDKETTDDEESVEDDDVNYEETATEDEEDRKLLEMLDNPARIEVADDDAMTDSFVHNGVIPTETMNYLPHGDPTMEEKDRTDSREGKEMMEGGTSTNTPTVDRDERINDLEKTDDIHIEVGEDSSEIEEIPIERSGRKEGMRDTSDDQIERNVFVENTIVLDDEVEVQEVPMATNRRREGDNVLPDLIEEEQKVIGPPKSRTMTILKARDVKNMKIQKWVNKIMPYPVDEEEEEGKPEREKSVEQEKKDDEDDFEWDSVSHSGRHQHLVEGETRGRRVHGGADDEVEVIELD